MKATPKCESQLSRYMCKHFEHTRWIMTFTHCGLEKWTTQSFYIYMYKYTPTTISKENCNVPTCVTSAPSFLPLSFHFLSSYPATPSGEQIKDPSSAWARHLSSWCVFGKMPAMHQTPPTYKEHVLWQKGL